MEQNKRIRKVVNSVKQPSKHCIWLKDGKLYYYGTTGWTEIQGQDKVNIEDIKEVTITENGEVTITPSEGYDATMGVTINTQVTGKPKTLDITKNGTYTVVSDDQPISQVTINAKVKDEVTTLTDVDGMKYQGSTVTKFPDGLKFAPRTGGNCVDMFRECKKLTEIPLFDTSKVTNMTTMFSYCNQLVSVPEFDTSNVTNMSSLFYSCSQLKSVPAFNTSNVTNTDHMFYSCSQLEYVPLFDTSKVTGMGSMFFGCSKLKFVPFFDTSKVSDMSNLFRGCSQLEEVPAFDTSNATVMSNLFYSCSKLVSVPLFDVSNVNNASNMFFGCGQLTTIGGFRGLKTSLDISSSPLLTHDSLLNVINEAADVTANPKTLTFGATNLAKLTDEEKAIATSKGWTLK